MKFVLTGKYLEIADVRGGIPHHGIDLGMPENTVLHSITNGYVDSILHDDKIGNGIIIKDQAGNSYIYGHLNKVEVQGPGQHVFAGQEIGLSGSTGNSTGPHLHFGMKDAHGQWVDPTPYKDQIDAASGSHSQWFLDNWNHTGDYVVGKETDMWNHAGDYVIGKESDMLSWFIDKWNHAGDVVIGKENEMLLKPFLALFKELGREFWHWFILNLPDMMGYTAIGAGILIILSAMMGKGILKPIGWFTGAFIFATCILGGAK